MLEDVDILFLASIFVDRDRQRRGYGERPWRERLRRLRHWRRAHRKRSRPVRWW